MTNPPDRDISIASLEAVLVTAGSAAVELAFERPLPLKILPILLCSSHDSFEGGAEGVLGTDGILTKAGLETTSLGADIFCGSEVSRAIPDGYGVGVVTSCGELGDGEVLYRPEASRRWRAVAGRILVGLERGLDALLARLAVPGIAKLPAKESLEPRPLLVLGGRLDSRDIGGDMVEPGEP